MNNKEEILNKLFALQRFGIKPGLERTLKLSATVGNPHNKFKSIHVAGTNGKGSVCSLLASILKEAGYTVGLYTSPHIKDFNERIRINGKKISDEELVNIATQLLPYQKKFNNTFFEITTILAFKYFANNNVDIAIIETGMGGRFDSTNILHPILSIITKIDIDHTQYLGNTIDEITFEKAGIMKTNTNTIISTENLEFNKIFADYSKLIGGKYEFTSQNYLTDIHYNNDLSLSFNIYFRNTEIKNLKLQLAGKHQVDNINLAISSIENISEFFNIDDKAIFNGFKNILRNSGYLGRIYNLREKLSLKNHLILDVAHNPNAISKTIETLNTHFPNQHKWNIVFGAMKDKDINKSLEILKPYCKRLIITQPKIDRSASIDDIIKIANQLEIYYQAERNIDKISKKIFELSEPSIVVGSFYLVGDFISSIEKMLNIKIEI